MNVKQTASRVSAGAGLFLLLSGCQFEQVPPELSITHQGEEVEDWVALPSQDTPLELRIRAEPLAGHLVNVGMSIGYRHHELDFFYRDDRDGYDSTFTRTLEDSKESYTITAYGNKGNTERKFDVYYGLDYVLDNVQYGSDPLPPIINTTSSPFRLQADLDGLFGRYNDSDYTDAIEFSLKREEWDGTEFQLISDFTSYAMGDQIDVPDDEAKLRYTLKITNEPAHQEVDASFIVYNHDYSFSQPLGEHPHKADGSRTETIHWGPFLDNIIGPGNWRVELGVDKYFDQQYTSGTQGDFVMDSVGEYYIRFIVEDDGIEYASDWQATGFISSNTPPPEPISSIGNSLTFNGGDLLSIPFDGVIDADGDPLTYRFWLNKEGYYVNMNLTNYFDPASRTLEWLIPYHYGSSSGELYQVIVRTNDGYQSSAQEIINVTVFD